MTHEIFGLLVAALAVSAAVGVASLLAISLATSQRTRSLAMRFCFVSVAIALLSWVTYAWVARSPEAPFIRLLVNPEAATHFYLPLAVFLAIAYLLKRFVRMRSRSKASAGTAA
jgi:uncharacterized protein with PQ loop repeat